MDALADDGSAQRAVGHFSITKLQWGTLAPLAAARALTPSMAPPAQCARRCPAPAVAAGWARGPAPHAAVSRWRPPQAG
eukprot:gene24748-51681_t